MSAVITSQGRVASLHRNTDSSLQFKLKKTFSLFIYVDSQDLYTMEPNVIELTRVDHPHLVEE